MNERCVQCQVGQGRDCKCDNGPAPAIWRWVMYALCGWSLIAAGVLAFMNPEWLQWR